MIDATETIEDQVAEHPRESKPWLDLIEHAEKHYATYNTKATQRPWH